MLIGIMFLAVFIPTIIFVFFNFIEKVWLELPEKTIRVTGKIFSENKNNFEHEIVVTLYQEELIILVGERSEEKVKVFKIAVILLETETQKIAVYIDTLRVGYLSKINAFEYIRFLKTKGFNENDAFEADALIIGSLIDKQLNISKWCVKLDIPNNMHKFRFDGY